MNIVHVEREIWRLFDFIYPYFDRKFNPSFHEGEETKYQIVFRREWEEGGVGTVLVFNSLLYKSTPVKEMGDGFLLITLPSAEGKLTSYLFKPVSDHSLSDLKKGIEDSIASI